MTKGVPMDSTAQANMRTGQEWRRAKEERVKKMLVDQKCFDLAHHFLSDVEGATLYDVNEMAENIQVAIAGCRSHARLCHAHKECLPYHHDRPDLPRNAAGRGISARERSLCWLA